MSRLMTTARPLVLASASPRRRLLLARLGLEFEAHPATLPEVPGDGEAPDRFALRAAVGKASEVAGRVRGPLVLAADTVVSIGGSILGKPADLSDAERMLAMLSGGVHSVFTAVALVDTRRPRLVAEVDETRVWFRKLDPEEIRSYVRENDILDKAGAYAIQFPASTFIARIEGNYSTVVGLPLPLVHDMLSERGLFSGD